MLCTECIGTFSCVMVFVICFVGFTNMLLLPFHVRDFSVRFQIADFGVSDEFQSDDILLTGSAGTPAFMAPETLREGADSFHGRVC